MVDTYAAIAHQDTADVVSASWVTCENDLSAGYGQAENEIFEQLALQGQSMFSGSGDWGINGCVDSLTGPFVQNSIDPSSQPWVTGTGGTSLEAYNPKMNPRTPARRLAARRPSGTSTISAAPRDRRQTTTTRAGASGAWRWALAAAAASASTGAGRSTSSGRVSVARPFRTRLAGGTPPAAPSAFSRPPAFRAARSRTCQHQPLGVLPAAQRPEAVLQRHHRHRPATAPLPATACSRLRRAMTWPPASGPGR